ncbi:hypothetical protein [Arthrobacter sp. CAL618]|uniref:hypothetical protein n=1 Tax=Arthrobacter sp. CAL618 TaxID=1055770 RepID=UPI0004655DCF|nr:hypothetical protein [Arthrobacter sp. CAL618]
MSPESHQAALPQATSVTTRKPKVRRVRDYRTFDRMLAAILLPLGPIAVSFIRFLLPGAPVGETIAVNQAVQQTVLWLGVVALFTLLPGAWAALQLTRRHRPGLSLATGVFLIPGYLALSVLTGMDAALLAATKIGLTPEQVSALSDELLSLPSQDLLLTVFIIGHIVGVVLLGILCFRARLMPRIVALLLIISQPLHLFAVITDIRWVDLLAWNLTTLGMAFLAWKLLRTPNDSWELGPHSHDSSR